MADNQNINLATFDFDITKIDANIKTLGDRMFALRKEQESLRKSYSDSQKEINDLIKVNGLLANANQKNSQAYIDNEKRIEELTASQQENFRSQQTLATQSARVREEYNRTNQARRITLDALGEETTAQANLDNALKKEINTRAEAKASNIELNRIKDQLNVNNVEESKLLDIINEKVNENNKLIKDSGSAYEQQVSNVGNYTESIQNAFSDLDIFNGGLTGFIGRADEAGGATALLGNSMRSASTAIVGLTKSMLAFLLTPIGATLGIIAGAFVLIQNAMNRNEESANKLKVAFSAFSGILNLVLKALEPLGEFLIDGLVKGFELASNAAMAAIELIASGLEAIGFEDAAAGVREFSNEIKQATKDAATLAEAEIALEKAQRKARLTQLQYQKEAEQFRQIRDDENRSIAERIKANNQLGQVLERQLKDELAIAKQALLVANLRIKAEGSSKETLDAQADALTEIADIEERITGQRSEQLANRVSLEKEAQTQISEAQDKAIAKQKELLDLYIAQQGDRARTLEEQLKLEQEISKRSIAILDSELKAKKISRTKYNTEVIELQNDLLRRQSELAVENAEIELDAFKKLNESKIKENVHLTALNVAEEKNRLEIIGEQESRFEAERLAQGIINETEYNAEILRITEETALAKNEIQKRYDETLRTDRELSRTLEYENEMLQLQERNALQFEQDLLRLEFEGSEKQIKLDEQKANGLISEENYQKALQNLEQETANRKKEIQTLESETKLSIASQTYGNLAILAGKESAAGKAFAIAQTFIDTYQSATSAFKSLAGIPVVGPTLGAIAAAAAVKTGLDTVKKITAVPKPKAEPGQRFASGVIGINGSGSGISDTIPSLLSPGESVITAQATSMFPQLLSQINQAGGGVGISNNSFVQQSLTDTAGFGINANEILIAVREGAAQGSALGSESGSQKGIRDMATDRNIQQSAAI